MVWLKYLIAAAERYLRMSDREEGIGEETRGGGLFRTKVTGEDQ